MKWSTRTAIRRDVLRKWLFQNLASLVVIARRSAGLGSWHAPENTFATYRLCNSARPGIEPKIGRTNPTKASDGSSLWKMYLNQFRGSVPARTDSSRNGNETLYPEHVTIASTSAEVPSVKRTVLPWQDAISRLGTTWPDSTRERTSVLLLKNDRL